MKYCNNGYKKKYIVIYRNIEYKYYIFYYMYNDINLYINLYIIYLYIYAITIKNIKFNNFIICFIHIYSKLTKTIFFILIY